MAASLKDFSTELASAVDRASQSVVRINARRGRAGSGIVWGDNLIVTADHVVENDDEIQVTAGEKTVKATVVGRDPGSDLAVLRAEGLSAPAFPRGSSADLKIGNLVLAIGRPNGLQATMGMVSSLGSAWRNWRGGDPDRRQPEDARPHQAAVPGHRHPAGAVGRGGPGEGQPGGRPPGSQRRG